MVKLKGVRNKLQYNETSNELRLNEKLQKIQIGITDRSTKATKLRLKRIFTFIQMSDVNRFKMQFQFASFRFCEV